MDWKIRARSFAQEIMRPAVASSDQSFFDAKEFMAIANQAGLRHWWIPTEYGGAGVTSHLTNAIIAEELAWGCVGLLESVSGPSLPGRFILSLGNDEQKKTCLSQLARQDRVVTAAFALTEEAAGSNVNAIATEAVETPTGFIINGRKKFITNGDIADFIVLAAKIKNSGSEIFKLFIVDKSVSGPVECRRLKTSGVRAAHVTEMTFDNYRIPKDSLLGWGQRETTESDLMAFLRVMELARIGVGGAAIGVGRAAWDYAVEYAKNRRSSSGPLIENQGISFSLIDGHAELAAARCLVHEAARIADRNEPFGESQANLSKLFAAAAAEKMVLRCSDVLSAHGFLEGNLIEKLMRDVRVCKIWEGTPHILRMSAANSLW